MAEPTVETLRKILKYDPLTGLLTWAENRGSVSAGDAAGVLRRHGYIEVRVNGQSFVAHRLGWILHNQEPIPSGMQIDHINGNRSDNRIVNLRLASVCENLWNSKGRKKVAGTLKGATYHKKSGTWQARISARGKLHQLGYFATEEEAHAAYRDASIRLHGAFSNSGDRKS